MKTLPTPVMAPFLEALEARIAPAGLNEAAIFAATANSAILVKAGQGLSTSDVGGSYLLYVEKGQALVFTSDFNNNSQVDFNEITGIAAGDGLRLISFVDIHGSIITNLTAEGELTDSTPIDDELLEPGSTYGLNGNDGQIILNSRIEKIELRSLTSSDITVTASNTVEQRLARSTYSILGDIIAGGGVGTSLAADGIIINNAGNELQAGKYSGSGSGQELYTESVPTLGSIVAGTATTDRFFSLGYNDGERLFGTTATFTPAAFQAGADINGVRAVGETTKFIIADIIAGDGGLGARGGNVSNVALNGDVGGYRIIAGNGGDGAVGGAGGNLAAISDLGSLTAEIYLQTGNGGNGLTGAGGNGGTATLGNLNVAAELNLILGSGGNGFTTGGTGSSLNSLVMNVQITPVSQAVVIVSSLHQTGDIGTYTPVDFDNDGLNDFVYASSGPDQLVVVYGDDTKSPLLLNAPGGVSDVVLGDFDNDGDIDVAASSSDLRYAGAGLSVFLNQGNGAFGGVIYSAVAKFNSLRQAVPIYDLAAGDFDGDGNIDLAFVGEYLFDRDDGPIVRLVVQFGDGSGMFTPDGPAVGVSDTALFPSPNTGINPPYFTAQTRIETTALATGDAQSVITSINGDAFRIFTITPGNPTQINFLVDTAGTPTSEGGNELLLDQAILDIDNDGDADFLLLETISTVDDAGGVRVVLGDGLGGIAPSDGNPFAGTFQLIAVTDADGDGDFDDVALYSAGSSDEPPTVSEFFITGPLPADVTADGVFTFIPPATNNGSAVFAPYTRTTGAAANYIVALPNGDTTSNNFSLLQSEGNTGADEFILPLVTRDWVISAGDGGNAITGAAGAGGSLGRGKLVSGASGISSDINIILPNNPAFGADIYLNAGNGGNGYLSGGVGGSVSGVAVRYVAGTTILSTNVFLAAGDGGFSLGGRGGGGGAISKVTIDTGVVFIAGAGGAGLSGGAGGSVTGNGLSNVYDTKDIFTAIRAGDGGVGILSGGAGGSISRFNMVPIALVQGVGGLLQFFAGNGGNAAAGTGGSGGAVIDSSPDKIINNLAGDFALYGGNGGDGLTGGAGGSITSIVNSPTQGNVPTSFTAIAGSGGFGVTGSGGAGGNISGTNVTARANVPVSVGSLAIASRSYSFDASAADTPPYGILDVLVDEGPLAFNRVVAGNGGDSFGATGGLGGSIISTTSTTTNQGIVAVAGQGGVGLTTGGRGGSVSSSSFNSTNGADGKVVVISGKGGDVFAFLAPKTATALQSLEAFGGRDGIGGAGGDILNFKQVGEVNASIDLIAGNGGSTINYGTPIDVKTNVGKGGSISGINIQANIGDVRPGVAIKSYGNPGDTIDDFVQNFVLATPGVVLDSTIGNVGLVTGIAGRVADGFATNTGVNGSATNITARSIMSMVAGSVDRIAAIQVISGITTSASGIFAADKNLLNVVEYLDEVGAPTNTVELGGALIDGAIVGKTVPASISGLARVFTR
jgi:hypothetical protein